MPPFVRPVETRPGSSGLLELASRVASACVRNLKLQDAATLCLCSWLTVRTLIDPRATQSHTGLVPVLTLFCAGLLTILLTRGEIISAGPERALVYRCGMFGTLAGSYFVLRPVLAALQLNLLDTQLLALDTKLFGQTPALLLDRFVTRGSVEWFAFFYFGYYALLASYVVGTLLFESGARRYELLAAVALVMSVGQIVYTLVPGAGPHACPGLRFDHALHGGMWWGRVEAAVNAAGANFDIFPSLHTANSVVTGLHAFRHRRAAPFKWVYLPTCFTVLNIVIATMFLRWHYGIDVIAGIALAVAAQRCAIHCWKHDDLDAASEGRQAVWERILPRDIALDDRVLVMGVFVLQALAIILLISYG
jgi:hypothetical protein